MEFPILSFIVSILSMFAGNETSSISKSVINNTKTTLPVQFVIQNITAKMRFPTPTISTTAQPQFPEILALCPDLDSSDFGLQLKTRYHNQTKKCYTVPSQGPCGNNMAYFADDDIFGECGCKSDNRLLIYNKRQNQCYYIFQQGYCGKTQWLDITREGKPICTRNPCIIRSSNSKKDLVQFQRKCVEVGEIASDCPEGEVIGFKPFNRNPTCINKMIPIVSPRAIGVPTTPCSLGSVMAIDGRCNPPFDFD